MITVPANQRRQWTGPERVASLQGQIDAITAKGQVAWVDVKDNGDPIFTRPRMAPCRLTSRAPRGKPSLDERRAQMALVHDGALPGLDTF